MGDQLLQVEHVTFCTDVAERAVRTQTYARQDWGQIWRETSAVTPDAIKAELRASYERIKTLIADTAEWPSDRHVGGAIGIIAHTAHHPGEIRQALCTSKSDA